MLKKLNRFSFGATSSITTSLSIIVGLNSGAQVKTTIIGALAVLALADNISDSLGIHIYRESESAGQPKIHTITNFLSRLFLTCVFAAIVFLAPMPYVVPVSIILGLFILSALSYFIAVDQNMNPYTEIPKHLSITLVAMVTSHFVGKFVSAHLG